MYVGFPGTKWDDAQLQPKLFHTGCLRCCCCQLFSHHCWCLCQVHSRAGGSKKIFLDASPLIAIPAAGNNLMKHDPVAPDKVLNFNLALSMASSSCDCCSWPSRRFCWIQQFWAQIVWFLFKTYGTSLITSLNSSPNTCSHECRSRSHVYWPSLVLQWALSPQHHIWTVWAKAFWCHLQHSTTAVANLDLIWLW